MERLSTAALYNQHIRPQLAELLGSILFTFLLGFAGHANSFQPLVYPIIAGLALFTAQSVCIKVSEAHLNPAVSLAHLIIGNLSGPKALAFIFCQFIGGLAGTCLHKALVNSADFADSAAAAAGDSSVNRIEAFLLEMTMTAIFCYVHMETDHTNGGTRAVVWGAISFAVFPTIGSSNNVSVEFAQAVIQQFFLPSLSYRLQLIYLNVLATIAAAGIAVSFHLVLREQPDPGIITTAMMAKDA